MGPVADTADVLAAAVMALTFLLGSMIHPLQSVVRDRRVLVSFGAGVAAAYLFVGMMPELAQAMTELDRAEAEAGAGPRGIMVFVMALFGFLIFYGLDHTTTILARPEGDIPETATEGRVYGYGLYVWLITYVMVLEADGSAQATLWYAIAMSLHFLTIDHTLIAQRGRLYDRRGRYLLAACVVLGWATAQVFELSPVMIALALGFVAGALTVNSAIMELSEGANGHFPFFLLGSSLFTAVLLWVEKLS
jgi:hypothetical protein